VCNDVSRASPAPSSYCHGERSQPVRVKQYRIHDQDQPCSELALWRAKNRNNGEGTDHGYGYVHTSIKLLHHPLCMAALRMFGRFWLNLTTVSALFLLLVSSVEGNIGGERPSPEKVVSEVDALADKCLQLIRDNLHAEAVPIINQLLAIDPAHHQAHSWKTFSLFNAGNVADAILAAEVGLQVTPNDSNLWNTLGEMRRRQRHAFSIP
jgi:hypothetical protein